MASLTPLALPIYPKKIPRGFRWNIELGGNHPIRVQSMTTTDTLDIQATARQSIELAEAGCEIVRITAPNVRAAEALGQIRKEIHKAKVDVPLVADIHFMPNAAMEAAKHVEKVRVNPATTPTGKNFRSVSTPIPSTRRNWKDYTKNFLPSCSDVRSSADPCVLVPIMAPFPIGS